MYDVLREDVLQDADLGPGSAHNLLQPVVGLALRGERDGEGVRAKPAGPTYPVEVGVGVRGDVQVNHQVHILRVNASRRQVGGAQNSEEGNSMKKNCEQEDYFLCREFFSDLHTQHAIYKGCNVSDSDTHG